MDFPFTEKKVLKNTMEFIPCVEVLNNPDAFGTEGTGEFEWLANQIVAHDEMVKNIRANLSFFETPHCRRRGQSKTLSKQMAATHLNDPAFQVNLDSSQSFLSSSTFAQIT